VNTQTKDVICVRIVKPLLVMLTIVHNAYSSHMVHNLTTLRVKEIVPTVVPTVADEKKERQKEKCYFMGQVEN